MDHPKTILINNGNHKSKDEVDYRNLLNKYLFSKWYLYLISLVLFVGLAHFYSKIVQPKYEITGKLLIRESAQDIGPQDEWLKRNLNFAGASESVTNEIQTLTSFWLMDAVVNDLNLDRQYYWKYKLSKIEGYHDFPILVDTFSLNPVDKTTFQVIPIDEQTFTFAQDKEIGTYKFGELFSNQFGTFRIQKTGEFPLVSDSIMHVNFMKPKAVAENYLKNLSVGLSDTKNTSSILIMSMKDAVPRRGIDLMNLLVERYKEFKSKEKTDITLNTLEFIDERLVDIGSELQSLESSVEKYKLSNDIASETTSDLDIVLQNVNSLVERQKEIEIQRRLLDAMEAELRDTSNNYELIAVNASLANTQIQELVKPYNDLVLQRKQLLETGLPSNPVVRSVNQKLNSLRTSIKSSVDNMQNDLRLKQQADKSQYEASVSRLRSVPTKQRALMDKERKQSITENLYVYLLQKKEEAALALVSNYSNSYFVDPPHSSIGPVDPNVKVFYLGGAVGGFAIPFFLLLLVDLFRNSVETEQELKMMLPGQPIMGIISHHKGKDRQVLLNKGRDLISERFRSLRTNLQLHYKEDGKCILVTSSTCNEGKTFISANLATSFAMINKKTVIIDFDLRKPEMMDQYEEDVEIGLSNYLVDEYGIEDIIQVSKTVPNLHYIASGPVLLNPVELLSEEKLDALFDYLKSNYDVIVVDTPPVGIVSDAILLNKYVNRSLFVVRSGYTTKEMVENAREIFNQEKLANPSVILNGVKKPKKGYGYSYKKYGYIQD